MTRPAPTAVLILAASAALVGVRPGTVRAGSGERTRTVLVESDPGDAVAAVVGSAGASEPVIIYLNGDGGQYTPGQPNDSRTNVSSIPDGPVDVPPWEGTDAERQELLACVADLFSPFAAVVTDQDPGETPHLEAVIGGQPTGFGLAPDVAGVSPFLTNCGVIEDSIVFIYPSVVGTDRRRLCETVAQEVAHSFGLDHQYLCEDPMTYLTGCGDKHFLFQESTCGELQPRDCKCGQSQNSAQMLLDRLGRSDQPSVWLSHPSPGDVLAAGFPVQAAITHAPARLELFLDGVLAGTVEPEETDDAYQLIDFDTSNLLRSGTHHLELIARFESQDYSTAALVEVEGVNREDVVTEGCAASGGRGRGAGGATGALVLALAVLAGRGPRRLRRIRPGPRSGSIGRRQAPSSGPEPDPRPVARPVSLRVPPGSLALWVLLAAALAGPAGCKTSVFGDEPEDIASGCPVADDVGAAIGVLWSAASGTCTATLVGGDVLITAAHCVADAARAGDPIVTVLGGRQYIAASAEAYPDWQPGAEADDVAVVTLTREAEGVAPLAIAPEAPSSGAEFTLVGHGAWTPDDPRDAERQAEVGLAIDVQARSFAYEDQEGIDGRCLGGRGGGPVMADGSPERLLGVHGEGRRVMRLDQYACWLACGVGASLAAMLPGGCDCARSDQRPCNDCGAEFLDQPSATWSACEPAEGLRPCGAGLSCDASGFCVAPPPIQ